MRTAAIRQARSAGTPAITALEHNSTPDDLAAPPSRFEGAGSFDDLLERLLASTCEVTEAPSASLQLFYFDFFIIFYERETLDRAGGTSRPDGAVWLAQRARPPFRGGTTDQMCCDPCPIIRNRLTGSAIVHPALVERHSQATLHVPVLSGGRLIGVLNAESVQPDGFTDEHVQRLMELARQVAPALERVWLLHQSGAAKLRERRLLAEVQLLRGTILELRAALEQYRSLVDPAQDMLVTIDRTLPISFISALAQHLQGYRPEELVGQPIEVLLDPHEHAAVRQHLEAALAGQPVPPIDLVHLRRRDGSVLEVEVHGASIFSAGQIVGRHYVVRDVTARREEQQRQSQAERLRVLGQLASGAAHPLNNLLAHITGQAEVALLHLRGPSADPAQVVPLLDTIVQLVDEGSQVIRRMQEFSRVRRDAPATDAVDLASVLHGVIELTRPRWKDEAQAASVRVEFILYLPEPRRVAGAGPYVPASGRQRRTATRGHRQPVTELP